MSEIITITRYELAEKCSEALVDLLEPEKVKPDFQLMMIMTVFSGLIVAKCFEEEQDNEENVSVNN